MFSLEEYNFKIRYDTKHTAKFANYHNAQTTMVIYITTTQSILIDTSVNVRLM